MAENKYTDPSLAHARDSAGEKDNRSKFLELFKQNPIPDADLMSNLGLFLKRMDLSHILYITELYKKIVNTHGVIMELGVRWGRNLALYEALRGIYEPHNLNRKIIGFDTFEGFPTLNKKDGDDELIKVGAYSVVDDYEDYLNAIMDCHEKESPISHIKKYELVKGDASNTVKDYLDKNPETIVALAYFDFDIYQPTKDCLQALKKHITKGTILAFDELNVHAFPGETEALREVLGLDTFRIRRFPFSSHASYIVVE